jgi:hypothetical protein
MMNEVFPVAAAVTVTNEDANNTTKNGIIDHAVSMMPNASLICTMLEFQRVCVSFAFFDFVIGLAYLLNNYGYMFVVGGIACCVVGIMGIVRRNKLLLILFILMQMAAVSYFIVFITKATMLTLFVILYGFPAVIFTCAYLKFLIKHDL